MQRKCTTCMKNSNKAFWFLTMTIFFSCSGFAEKDDGKRARPLNQDKIYCTTKDEKQGVAFDPKRGDLICSRESLTHKNGEKLKIVFKVTNKNSDDPYEYGYQELKRYRRNQVVETLKLRKKGDAYWSETPFVRIREQRYFSDLDGDGVDEFAVFPFHPGSAAYGTVRIFSLDKKITFWGLGKYHIEGDGHVLLNCMDCSKFKIEACRKRD